MGTLTMADILNYNKLFYVTATNEQYFNYKNT